MTMFSLPSMLAIFISLTLATVSVTAQFHPGPKDELISSTLGNQELACNEILIADPEELATGTKSIAASDVTHDTTLPVDGCINLFISCNDKVEVSWKDSTIRVCNLVSFSPPLPGFLSLLASSTSSYPPKTRFLKCFLVNFLMSRPHQPTPKIPKHNTDAGHTLTLPEEDYHSTLAADLENIKSNCHPYDFANDDGISGQVFHDDGSWVVEFGSVGAGCADGSAADNTV
ncbi:hypothetical protein MKZ38_005545 [Zalerion maritima]|uniref:Uncharacterized protein n=1 Tax=Zalerion maritima TaxID=339359 RepID=A0AAD5RK58_9PEZI|nr:hypothetical protein MKZ38_005545 [Zalerion maritima]